MKLIGLYSPARQSGKSEVARILANEFGYDVVKFADPLKNMTRAMYRSMGMTEEEIERRLEGDLKENQVPGLRFTTNRLIMDTLGTDWGRETIYWDIWVDITKSRIRRLAASDPIGGLIVVDDVRFDNEFETIKKLGGTMIRVARPDAPIDHDRAKYDGLLEGHPFDGEVLNNDTLEHLHNAARRLGNWI